MAEGRSRRIEVGRAAWGLALLLAPRLVLERVHRVQVDSRSLAVARVLGARQLAQAALSGIRPTPEILAVGVWVDTAHAITGGGLAVMDRSRARAAVTDMAVAGAWAILGYRDLVSDRLILDGQEHGRDRRARRLLSHLPLGDLLLVRVERARSSPRRITPAGEPGDPGAVPPGGSEGGTTGTPRGSGPGSAGPAAPVGPGTSRPPVLSLEQVRALQGGRVVDTHGAEIGAISRIFRDPTTGEAEWVTIGTGLFGNPETFIPLRAARFSRQGVAVAFTADNVRDAPRMTVEQQLEEDQVDLLHQYYDGAYPSS